MFQAPIPQRLVPLVLTIGLALLSACSNAGKGDGDAKGAAVNPNSELGADLTKPSRILVTPKTEWTGLKGYIVGRAESTALAPVADQPGKYGFQNLEAGLYGIVLEAQQQGADGKNHPVALKISGVSVGESSDAQIRDIELKPYIQLDGRAVLDGRSSEGHAGIEVAVSGTPLKTTTAADGSYRLEGVPQGEHALALKMDGFHPGFILEKSYATTEQVPTIALADEGIRLDTGVHYVGGPLALKTTQKISLQLKAPRPMNYFRHATGNESIESKPWQLLRSSFELDLPSGQPNVQVQYSLDQRQLSPIYSVTVPTE
jgi:hypothetical protein